MCPPTPRSKGMHTRQESDTTLETCSSTGDEDSVCSPGIQPSKKKFAAGTRGFIIKLSPRLLVTSLLLAALSAFLVGMICNTIILSRMQIIRQVHSSNVSGQDQMELPIPVVAKGKVVPYTTFTTRILPQGAALTSHTVHIDRKTPFMINTEALTMSSSEKLEEDISEDHDVVHLPAGQHLLVDIEGVDSTFLNSEERLATALVELINVSKLTLLSYHCHSLVPMGVSCAGVLLESHVAFHTWPLAGRIAIDLFTCGKGPLIPVLPVIENLFAIPRSLDYGLDDEAPAKPNMIWSHKLRGFREGFSPDYNKYENPLDQELGLDFLRKHDIDKIPLVSEETEFQAVDIYERIDRKLHSLASHGRFLSGDESYDQPAHFRSDKVLFLDGIEQSSLYGEAAYHEALVHPAMIAHANPKRVAIIGGGEGATLREILKHKSVEEVLMVEIDEELVNLCREYLPEWSDCSDIEGSNADSCFADSRANVVFEDAFQWFIAAFGKENINEDKFDVIIMDALDPDRFVAIVGSLYKDNRFVDSLYNGLSDDGVFVVQLGESHASTDPADEVGPLRDTANMMDALQHAGFESIHIYDEGHSHFSAPWSYLVCFKNYNTRARWYQTEAEIDLDLHQRLYKLKSSGKPALHYFDASTMASYQLPSKAQETTYCRKEDRPSECDEYLGIDPEIVNIPASLLSARKSTIPNGGRGLFADQDIPRGSTLVMEQATQAFHVLPSTWSLIDNWFKWAAKNDAVIPFVQNELSSLYTFIDGYGYKATLYGKIHFTIDSCIATFCNHGCNGTYTYGDDDIGFTEMNVDLDHPPASVFNNANIYSPVMERHLRQILGIGDEILREVKKDEEIFCNYLSFVGDTDDWEDEVLNLRSQCAGEGIGEILQYELSHDIDTCYDGLALTRNHTVACS